MSGSCDARDPVELAQKRIEQQQLRIADSKYRSFLLFHVAWYLAFVIVTNSSSLFDPARLSAGGFLFLFTTANWLAAIQDDPARLAAAAIVFSTIVGMAGHWLMRIGRGQGGAGRRKRIAVVAFIALVLWIHWMRLVYVVIESVIQTGK